MATSNKAPAFARVKTLHIGTTQGYAGLLSKDGQHVFSYAADVVADDGGACSISLTMPVRAESYHTTPMLPAFQTFLPEGFLALSLARQKAWPSRNLLLKFGRDHCRVNDPQPVIDRIANAATEHRPASDESGMWRKMKQEIDAAARSITR